MATKQGRKPRRARVFVLGAGVSASCGIPVAKDILREALVMLGNEDKPVQRRIHKLLEYLYPSFTEHLQNYPNIGDFLNLLEMARVFNREEFIQSQLWPPEELDLIDRSILKAVTDYIWGRMREEGAIRGICDFVKCCIKSGDTIITFNWDLTIEQALEREGTCDFWYTPPAEVLLLKPHGSIDWFERKRLPRSKSGAGALRLDERLSVYPRFSFAEYQELRACEPVIVAPVFQKQFNWEFLRATWRRVYRAISRATDVYVVGYSLPREDQFARFVMARALRNNRLKTERGEKRPLTLTVVNPDEAVRTTFTKLAGEGGRFRFVEARCEQFVVAVKEDALDLN